MAQACANHIGQVTGSLYPALKIMNPFTTQSIYPQSVRLQWI